MINFILAVIILLLMVFLLSLAMFIILIWGLFLIAKWKKWKDMTPEQIIQELRRR